MSSNSPDQFINSYTAQPQYPDMHEIPDYSIFELGRQLDGDTYNGLLIPSLPSSGKKFAVGVSVVALAALGTLFNSPGVENENTLHQATTKATIIEWKNTADILAAEGTFTTTSHAQLKVGINVTFKVLGKDIVPDQVTPDYEEQLGVTGIGKMPVIVPGVAITSVKHGDSLDVTVDESLVQISAHNEAVNNNVDDDDEKVSYQALTVLRDALVKFTPYDSQSIGKPDVWMNNITDNATTKLGNEALKSMMETCGPKLKGNVEDSIKLGVGRVAAQLATVPENNVRVTLKNGDKLHFGTMDSKLVKEFKLKYTEMEPKIEDFNFDKQSCDTSKMKVVGEQQKKQQ